jgi:cobalamin synthase
VVAVLVTVVIGRMRLASPATMGAWFADRVRLPDAAVALVSATIIAAALALVGGIVVPIAAIGAVLGGSAAGAVVVALRGRLDGDGMGALVELSVVSGLVVAALVS